MTIMRTAAESNEGRTTWRIKSWRIKTWRIKTWRIKTWRSWRPTATPSLVWAATAAGLAVMLAFFVAIGRDFYRSTLELTDQQARNIATLVEQDVARDIELYHLSLQAVLEGIADTEVMAQPPRLRQISLFDRSTTAQGLGALVVLDANGSIVLDSLASPVRRGNFADREYFRIHRDAPHDIGLYISKPFQARLQGDIWSLSLSRRVTRPDGSFGGIVSGTVKLDYIRQRFENVQLGTDGAITLFRDDGIVLARNSAGHDMTGRDLSTAPLFSHVSNGASSGTFWATAQSDGTFRFYAFKRVANLPLVVSVGLADSEVFAAWRNKIKMLSLVYLVMAASIVALVALFASELRRRETAEHAQAALARQDNLTGLANRRGFNEALDNEWQRATRERKPLSLVMIDIDHFKRFNDSRGHPEGDRVLAAVAAAVRRAGQRPADLAARYGGEELTMLLPDTDAKGARRIAEAILMNVRQLAEPHPTSEHGIITVSIGIATAFATQGAAPASLVTLADTALYAAKQSGRNLIRESNVSAADFTRQSMRLGA
jgi:diguanylate cyclase (GGDEF)-like protein